jgi:medium-chain acyl-[acyl-carrier-protein] hydrolase
MNPVAKLTESYRVMVGDVDFTKKLKPGAAFNYFQEIAGTHAANLGVGIDTIRRKHGVIWVMTRIRVDVERYPGWDENIVIETWPQQPKRFEFERHYIMRDIQGHILMRAVSFWVILDESTRELRKSEVINAQYPEFLTERAIDCSLGKIKPTGEPETVYKRWIGCSDIDMNGHINNSRYVDFIMDCFTMDELRGHRTNSIQVSYLGEAFPGDTLVMRKYTGSSETGGIYVEGIREKDENVIFRAQMDMVEG